MCGLRGHSLVVLDPCSGLLASGSSCWELRSVSSGDWMVSAAWVFVVIDLLCFPLSSLLPPCPHLLLPMGSWPCFPDVQAGLGIVAEADFLLAQGRKEE